MILRPVRLFLPSLLAGVLSVAVIVAGVALNPAQTEAARSADATLVTSLQPGGQNGLLSFPRAVWIDGNYAYLANYDRDSLAIIDITDPEHPVFVSEERGPTPGTSLDGVRAVTVKGNYAYMGTANRQSVAVIDISNKQDPVFITEVRPQVGYALLLQGNSDVFIKGNLLYTANTIRDSIAIFDITDPINPVMLSELRPGSNGTLDNAVHVEVVGDYAYIASYNRDSLGIANVADPVHPVMVTEFMPGQFDGIIALRVIDNLVYITSNDGDAFSIVDVTNPAAPVLVSHLQPGGLNGGLDGARGLEVRDGYAFVTNILRHSFVIIDVADPANPVIVDEVRPPGPNGDPTGVGSLLWGAGAVVLKNDYAFTANSYGDSFGVLKLTLSASATTTPATTTPPVVATTTPTTTAPIVTAFDLDINTLNVKVLGQFLGALHASSTVHFSNLTKGFGIGALCLTSTGEVVASTGSDSCLPSLLGAKQGVQLMNLNALQLIELLHPTTFTFADGVTRYGFTAEEAAQVDARFGTYNGTVLTGTDDRAILSVLVQAVQELAAKVSETAHLIVATLTASRVETDVLCVGETCITEAQLIDLLEEANAQPAAMPAPQEEPEAAPPEPSAEPVQ